MYIYILTLVVIFKLRNIFEVNFVNLYVSFQTQKYT